MTPRKIAAVLGALAMSMAMAGCGGAPNVTGAEPASAGAGATQDPVTLENCGKEVTFEGAPQRAVTMNQSAAETLIHLGVGDRIVGTGYEIDKVPEEIAAEYGKIPMISAHGQPPKHEALLEVQPHFAYS